MFRILFLSILITAVTIAEINYDAGVEHGRITWYAQSNVVACDIPMSEWPTYTAALSEAHFQRGLACGATARLIKNGKEIQVMIVDLCPKDENPQWCSGDMTHFDLGGTNAFSQLESVETGVTELDFEWLPTPVGNSPVKLRFKDQVNEYWVAIQVLNHRYPVAKLEINDPQSGSWLTGDRTEEGMWNYWQFNFSQALQTPFQIRITDQYGQVIEETASTIQGDYMWTGQNQFPLLQRHGGTTDIQGLSPGINNVLRVGQWTDTPYIVQNKLYLGKLKYAKIVIFDIFGRMKASMELPKERNFLNLPKLNAGIYLVRIMGINSSQTLRWILYR